MTRGETPCAPTVRLTTVPRSPTERLELHPDAVRKRWYTVTEVAVMLGFGLSKTKMLVATGELRSLKDGKHRRVLPEWVDEYVTRRAEESAA